MIILFYFIFYFIIFLFLLSLPLSRPFFPSFVEVMRRKERWERTGIRAEETGDYFCFYFYYYNFSFSSFFCFLVFIFSYFYLLFFPFFWCLFLFSLSFLRLFLLSFLIFYPHPRSAQQKKQKTAKRGWKMRNDKRRRKEKIKIIKIKSKKISEGEKRMKWKNKIHRSFPNNLVLFYFSFVFFFVFIFSPLFFILLEASVVLRKRRSGEYWK